MRREVEQAERDVAAADRLALDQRRAQRFETRVVAAFKYGQMSLTDVFTSMRDINDIVVTSTYVSAVVQNDRSMVEEMADLLACELSTRSVEPKPSQLRVEADARTRCGGRRIEN
jgi:predicted transcriptional regulator